MSENHHNGYRPVQSTGASQRDEDDKDEDGEGAWQDQDLLQPEERCLCGALQRFASPYAFGAFACLLNFLQAAAFSGTGSSVLTTIEKRFQLKTSELAPFLIVNDIMSVIMVLFVAYYGHTGHRPRIIGGGSVLIGIGLLLCTLPQFVYETPSQFSLEIGRNENGTAGGFSQDGKSLIYPVCQVKNATEGNGDTPVCTLEEEETSGSLMWQVSWIIIGQILTGIGAAPIMPLAVTYMDDNLKRTSTSVYVACMFVASSFGPLLGAGIAGFSLSWHADFYKAPVYAQPGDPNWLGAWWMGFAITGVMLILVGVPILLFPKKIRRTAPVKEAAREKGTEAAALEDEDEERDVGGMYRLNVKESGKGKCAYVKGFLGAIRRLVTNMTFLTLILGVCAMLLSFGGLIIFMAKYLETQFGLPASTAPMLFGIIMPPGSLFGNLIGGIVVKKLKLTKKGLARMVVVLKPIVFILAPMFFFLGCENRDIAGLTVPYPSTNRTSVGLPDLTAGCNVDCACPTEYTPVCGSDGVTYATPCHAGCLAMVENVTIGDSSERTLYTDCGCIGVRSKENSSGWSGDNEHIAIPGECPRPCNTLIPFIAAAMTSVLIGSVVGNPGFMLQLRAVDEDDRSIAVGFTSMMLRLIGFIPSPIVFGSAIQTTCILLQSSCGRTGNCLVYDIVHFRYVFYALSIGLDVVSLTMFILCYISIKDKKVTEGFEELAEAGPDTIITSEGKKESTV